MSVFFLLQQNEASHARHPAWMVCAIVVCTADYLSSPSVTERRLLFYLLIADSVRRITTVTAQGV